jgi:hypothetical protein
MTSDFAALKNSRKTTASKLREDAEKLNQKKNDDDDDPRIWKPTRDKAGNGFAIIRFLPPSQGEAEAWVRYYDHWFQHHKTKKWYIENSLTTFGFDNPDPMQEYNNMCYDRGDDEGKAIAKNQARKLHYISNILVITDSAVPENDGKVFLYEYGPKIFGKMNEKMNPNNPIEEPIIPFDFWEGCDFKLKIHSEVMEFDDGKKRSVPNYDNSEWDAIRPLFVHASGDTDDTKIEELWNKQYPLFEFVDPDNKKRFKSYEDLKKRRDFVLGLSGAAASQLAQTAEQADDEPEAEAEQQQEEAAPEASQEAPAEQAAPEVSAEEAKDLAVGGDEETGVIHHDYTPPHDPETGEILEDEAQEEHPDPEPTPEPKEEAKAEPEDEASYFENLANED